MMVNGDRWPDGERTEGRPLLPSWQASLGCEGVGVVPSKLGQSIQFSRNGQDPSTQSQQGDSRASCPSATTRQKTIYGGALQDPQRPPGVERDCPGTTGSSALMDGL